MKITNILLYLSICIISGCSSGYSVTFDSSPQGATLVCDGRNWGYTPITLTYELEKNQEILNVSDCTAYWISGAKEKYGSIPIQEFPDGVITTVYRPDNIKGYEKDAAFALQIQQLKLQEKQLELQKEMLWQQKSQARQNQRNMNKTVHCYTNFGFTTCY